MEKEILDGIRKELEALRERIDALSARLEEAESMEGKDMSFDEPVSLDDINTPAPEAVAFAAAAGVNAGAGVVDSENSTVKEAVPSVEPAPGAAGNDDLPEPEKAAPVLPEYKWCKDECGTRISNVISGISLNDRLLIINCLFGEDPMAFQKAITDINALESFAAAVEYVMKNHSGWQMSSSPVYTFMMAVRRRFN